MKPRNETSNQGSQVRDAGVTGTVDGKNLGNLNFANLAENTR
jgi:hypothetical protein